MQNGQLRTSCCSVVSTSSGSKSSSTSTSLDLSSTSPAQERSDELAPREWCGPPSKTQNKNQKRDSSRDAGDGLRDLPEWWEEFRYDLEDAELHAPAHISQYADSERLTKVVSILRKHSMYTHFPKDRNCEVCLLTTMTRALCRRRTGEAVPRAEKFDLITADHKVLNEEGESRNNHRCTIVVQDLATQCIQSDPCETKTSQETDKSLRKFLEPSHSEKLLTVIIHWNLGKYCEDLSWNRRTSTPHRIDPRQWHR